MMDYFEARERIRSRYGHKVDIREVAKAKTEPLGDKGFLTQIAGKVILTAPSTTFTESIELPRELASRWRETASGANPYYTWLQARYVEAERANLNGAFWSTSDLQFGEPSVKYGPLNWLHNEKQVVGTLVDGALVQPGREMARQYTEAQRQEMAKNGEALPDGSYPIHDKVDLEDAIRAIGRAKDAGEAKAHIEKRAKELKAENLLPSDWSKATAALLDSRDRPYLATMATVWDWVHPEKAAAVKQFNDRGSLWVSMECTGKQIACVSDGSRTGCGEAFDYITAMTKPEETCEHLADRSSARRIVDPTFLGAGIIVPPERPAWADASAEIMRATAALAESAHSSAIDMPDEAWFALVASVVANGAS